MLKRLSGSQKCKNAMILSKIAYLRAVEITLVYTRLGDLKIRCGAKDLGCGTNRR